MKMIFQRVKQFVYYNQYTRHTTLAMVCNTAFQKLQSYFPYTFKIYEKNKELQLGRWKNTDCQDKTFSRVDYNNIDHCGPCGLGDIEMIKKNDEKKINNDNNARTDNN